MNTFDVVLAYVRAGLFGSQLDDGAKEYMNDPENAKNVFKLAEKHDIAHLVGYGLQKCDMLNEADPIGAAFSKAQFMAVYRYENMQHELGEILALFEREKIECIILKGAAIRKYYPERWLRTSCDIDILIHDSDSERAIAALQSEKNYKYTMKNFHDHQLYAPNGVHLELHYTLLEEDGAIKADELLDLVWEHTVKLEGYEYALEMDDDMFYCYHLIHMAKHMMMGGCGVRSILDVYILNQNVEYKQSAYELLKEGSLDRFESRARGLANVWFGGKDAEEWDLKFGDYVMNGGVYGNTENRVAANQSGKGGVFRYALWRIFLPYKLMAGRYPSLEKHKWMYPLYQFRRWYDLLFKGRAAYSFNELKLNQTLSKDQINQTNALMDELGLK